MGTAQQQDRFSPRKPLGWNHVAEGLWISTASNFSIRMGGALRHCLCAASKNYYKNLEGEKCSNGRRNLFIVVCFVLVHGLEAAAREWLCSDRDHSDLCSASPKAGTRCWMPSLEFLMMEKPGEKEIRSDIAPPGDCSDFCTKNPVFCVKMNNLGSDSLGKLLRPRRPSSTSKTWRV